MSHFTVLVIGDEPEKQLAPYQENNMGDCPKEYLFFNNVEEEYRESYETDTKMVEEVYYNWIRLPREEYDKLKSATEPTDIMVVEPLTLIDLDRYELYRVHTQDGEKEDGYMRVFSQNNLGHGKQIIKAQMVKKPLEVPVKDEMSWDEYMNDYCGYEFDEEQGAYGYWENPNRKWDWYQLGGRWNGYFQLKDGETKSGVVGNSGVFGSSRESCVGRADAARVGDIDFEAMMDESGEKARSHYRLIKRVLGGDIPMLEWTWQEVLDDESIPDIDEKRQKYRSQAAMRIVEAAQEGVRSGDIEVPEGHEHMFFFFHLEDYQCSEEEYVERARQSAISTFAVVKDGKWYEKGEMGWWATVSNEKSNWNEEFSSFFKDLPEDTMLSVYDCHI